MNAVKHWLESRPKTRVALLTLYYLALIVVLLVMYGRGKFDTPEFVYQEF